MVDVDVDAVHSFRALPGIIERKLSDISDYKEFLQSKEGGEVDLSSIVNSTGENISDIAKKFIDTGDEVDGLRSIHQMMSNHEPFIDTVCSVVSEAYVRYAETEFNQENPGYNAEDFLGSANNIAQSLNGVNAVDKFYSGISQAFEGSTKFIYKLIVQNLTSSLEAHGKSDKFSLFVHDVMDKTVEIVGWSASDKWSILQLEYSALEDKYFGTKQEEVRTPASEFGYRAIESYANMRPDQAIEAIESKYGPITNAGFSAQNDGGNTRLKYGLDGQSTSPIPINRSGVSSDVKDLMLAMGERALQNTPDVSLIPGINKYMSNVRSHL